MSDARQFLRAVTLLVATLALGDVAEATPTGGTLAAGHAQGSIQLDGRLSEPAWQQPLQVAELTQQSPRPGEPTPYKTEVRVLILKDTLYFGFLCTDPEPGKIAVHTMQRDGFVYGDDTVTIVLDTFGDRRTGYLFQINAAGARIDGLISDPENPSYDWDGIWDARTARSPRGWTAEIQIPAKTLNFKSGLPAWGLNVERFVAREQITLRWNSPTLDSFLYDLSRAGTLGGVEGLRQGRGLEFTPYTVGRMKGSFGGEARTWQGTGGFDFSWHLTPEMVAVFTANTDFAETEVDARQINLTRFPLFFPEKRAFFLEGSNQFEFGLGLGEDFIPFFTRRVGLFNDQQVPINGGVKLLGRAGKWNVGLLDVQTRDSVVAPGTNLLAGRISYDLTKKLRIGTIFTNGDPAGLRSNTLNGFDAVWRTSTFRGNKNLLVGGWTAFSSGDLPSGSRAGWGFKVDYPNDLVDCGTLYDQFGEALDPALGFLPRPGTRQYYAGCAFRPRPSKSGAFGWIRQASFESRYWRSDYLDGSPQSWQVSLVPLGFTTESGEQFVFSLLPQFESLPEPFEITPGVVIPPGSHRFDRLQLEVETSHHRSWQVESATEFGSFYSGDLTRWRNSLSWTSSRGRLSLRLETENNFAHLREGNFVQRLWQLESQMALNPNLVLSSFIQYDTVTQNIGANNRLRWTIRPGRDLFIVYNHGWQRLLPSPGLSLIPDSEFLAVKIRWTFRE